jgi:hypothetical protein
MCWLDMPNTAGIGGVAWVSGSGVRMTSRKGFGASAGANIVARPWRSAQPCSMPPTPPTRLLPRPAKDTAQAVHRRLDPAPRRSTYTEQIGNGCLKPLGSLLCGPGTATSRLLPCLPKSELEGRSFWTIVMISSRMSVGGRHARAAARVTRKDSFGPQSHQ